jgi:uncharacterized membrane protein YciS (DUF1049 family)
VSTPQPPGIPDTPPVPVPPPAGAAPPGAPAPPIAAPPATEPSAEEDRPSRWQPFLYFKLGLLLAVIGYSIAFVVENSQQINIDFVFATAKVRLIWEILLLLAIGIVGGILLSQLYRHRRRAQLAKKSGKPRHSRSHVGGRDKAVGKSG